MQMEGHTETASDGLVHLMVFTMSNIILMDITGLNTIHTAGETTVENQSQRGPQIQTPGPSLSIIQAKKDKTVGAIKIESEIWKSICEGFSPIWSLDSLCFCV